MVLIMASTGLAAERSIRVLVDDTELQFDAQPYMENNRTLVPVRALAEKLGFTVGWDEAEQRVTLTKGDKTIALWIGSTKVMVNGKESTIDVAPTKANNRTYVPVRFVSEQLGTFVGWDDAAYAVKVSSGQGLLTKLNRQQQSQGDTKASANLLLTITMQNPQAPGMTISVPMQMQMVMQTYKNEALIKLTQDMSALGQGSITVLTAVKDGRIMAQDPKTKLWQQIGTFDPTKGMNQGALAEMDMTRLLKVQENLLKDVNVTVRGLEQVNNMKLVRIDADMSKIPMNDLIKQVSAMSGMPTDANVNVQIERFKVAYWLHPETMFAHKTALDMKMAVTTVQQGEPVTVGLAIRGEVIAEPVSEPIVWPEGL